MFGPKREEITLGWQKVYKEKLHKFYSSPYIIGVITSQRE
jgi:hypothetical protein